MPEISSRSNIPEWNQAKIEIEQRMPHLAGKGRKQEQDDAISHLALQYMHLDVLERADDPPPIQHHKVQHVKLEDAKPIGFKEKLFNFINSIHKFVKKLFTSESKSVQVKSPEVMAQLSPEKVGMPKKEAVKENKLADGKSEAQVSREIVDLPKSEPQVDQKKEKEESSFHFEDSDVEVSKSSSENEEEVSSSRRSTIKEKDESVSKSYIEADSPRSESPTPELQPSPSLFDQVPIQPESPLPSPKFKEEVQQAPISQPKPQSSPKFEEPITFTSEVNKPDKIKRLNEAVEKLKTLANSAKEGVQKEITSTFKEKCGSVFAGMWMKLTGSFDIKSWKEDPKNPGTYVLLFNKPPKAINLGVISLKIKAEPELKIKFVKEQNKVGIQIENLSLEPDFLDKTAGVKKGDLKLILLDSHGHIEMPGSVEREDPISIKSLK